MPNCRCSSDRLGAPLRVGLSWTKPRRKGCGGARPCGFDPSRFRIAATPRTKLRGFAPRARKASKRLHACRRGPSFGASLRLLPPSSPEGRVAYATLFYGGATRSLNGKMRRFWMPLAPVSSGVTQACFTGPQLHQLTHSETLGNRVLKPRRFPLQKPPFETLWRRRLIVG